MGPTRTRPDPHGPARTFLRRNSVGSVRARVVEFSYNDAWFSECRGWVPWGFYLNLWIPSSFEQSELSEKNPRPGLIVIKTLNIWRAIMVIKCCQNLFHPTKTVVMLASVTNDNKYN